MLRLLVSDWLIGFLHHLTETHLRHRSVPPASLPPLPALTRRGRAIEREKLDGAARFPQWSHGCQNWDGQIREECLVL